MITAEHKNTYQGLIDYARFYVRKIRLTSYIVWSVSLFACGILFLVLALLGVGSKGLDFALCVVLIIMSVAQIFIDEYVAVLNAKKKMANDSRLLTLKNDYKFEEDYFLILSDLGSGVQENKSSYQRLFAVFETEDKFYLCVNSSSTYIVDKKTIKGGNEVDLSNLLKSKVKKYKRIK